MAQVLFNDSIQSLVIASSSTITQAPSIITLGGQQYQSTSALTLNTAASGAGGIDTGVVAASTTYYVYGVLSGSALALVASLSSSTPTGFTQYSKIGAFSTDSSSAITDAYLDSEIEDVTLITERAIGSVGAAPQLATYGSLLAGDFPGATSATSFYTGNTNSNDASTNGRNLTAAAAMTFTGVGFFGNESITAFTGTSNGHLARTGDTFFNVNGASGVYSFGGWFYKGDNWSVSGSNQYMMVIGDSTTRIGFRLLTSGNIDAFGNVAATASNNLTPGWHHIVATINAGTIKLYVDGQLSATQTGLTSNVVASAAVIGDDGSPPAASNFRGLGQQFFFTQQTLSDSQINVLYSKRFKGGLAQIAGGHTVTANSFPLTTLSNKVNIYNLDTTNDSSVNVKHLTGDASPTNHSGLGITGTGNAATFSGAQSLKSTDSYFNFGGKAIGYGGWFAANDYTPTSRIVLMSLNDGASDRSIIAIETSPLGQVTFECTDSGGAKAAVFSNPGFIDGSWHHFALVQDGLSIYGFVDGVQVCQTSAVGYIVSLASPVFRISGRNASLSNPFPGRVSNAYAYKDLVLNGADIQKLAAARIDIGQTMNPARQQWEADFENESEKIKNDFGQSWLVDKRSDHIYVDFGGASADRVKLKLRKK